MTREQMANDQRWIYQDFPTEKIEINGFVYNCLRIEDSERRPAIDGGFRTEPEVTVLISMSDPEQLARLDIIKEGNRVVLGDRPMRIIRTERGPSKIHLKIELETPEK